METGGFSLGAFLRERRQQRVWTLTQLAQKAGIVKSTLSKWENGRVLPRLPELVTVLDILEVAASDRALLFQRLGRTASPPRKKSSPIQPIPKAFPVHGDLLRAMRRRALLSQQETARRAQIAQGTLAKWENGTDWPSAERLQKLGFALSATAEETAVLTTGIPTYFPAEGRTDGEPDLYEVELEIRQLRSRSYFQPFVPHDLWFLSLMARLWPTSLREDGIGRQALLLWARVAYLYVAWLYTSYRYEETREMANHFQECLKPRLSPETENQIWAWYAWVSIRGALTHLDQLLSEPRSFLRGRQLTVTVSSRIVQAVRAFTEQLSVIAENRAAHTNHINLAKYAHADNDLIQAFLAALEGDADTATQLDTRANAVYAALDSQWSQVDIAVRRAEIHYYRGDLARTLETLPEIPPPPADSAQLPQLLRLEQTRFRARVLLESQKATQKEEGHHLLSIFNREVVQLPMGSIRTQLGPLAV